VSTELTQPTSSGALQKPDDPAPPELEFKRLSEHCRRDAFSCGDREIDRWFRKDALKAHSRMGAGFRVVTAHLVGDPRPAGFYALCMYLENENNLEKSGRPKLFSRSGFFPTLRLGYLAVNRSMQRQKIGTTIMGAVLDDFYQIAVRTGVYALTLTASMGMRNAFISVLALSLMALQVSSRACCSRRNQ